MDQKTLNERGAVLVAKLVEAEKTQLPMIRARLTMTPEQQRILDTWSDANSEFVMKVMDLVEELINALGLDMEQALDEINNAPEPS
jgi:hypothetical protein